MPIVTMPKLSDTMLEGTLVKWRKKAGDNVEVGDILAEVETDKATMEMESFDEGKLTELYVEEGGIIKVGDKIALILADGESADTAAAPKPAAATPDKPKATAPAGKTPVAPAPRAAPRP
jgi:pyruvate dehydrogenase E2 component (dihydrolipoamide acetyltransferase)